MARFLTEAVIRKLVGDETYNQSKDIAKGISKEVSETLDKLFEDKINSYSQQIQSIEDFKSQLSTLSSKLESKSSQLEPNNKKLEPNNKTPIVIIIDELDRCRPTFAVEILETIKHLFSVPNVCFILVINKKQLVETIKSVYGQGFDATTYLEKFFTFEVELPKQARADKSNIQAYTQVLAGYYSFESSIFKLTEFKSKTNGSISSIADYLDITLRQLEKVYIVLTLFFSNELYEKEHNHIEVIVYLATIKIVNPSLFNDLRERKIEYSDFKKHQHVYLTDETHLNNRTLTKLIKDLDFFLSSKQALESAGNKDFDNYWRINFIPNVAGRMLNIS